MAQKKAHPAVRFLVAFLIVIAVAFVAFFVGYLLGMRIAVVPPPLRGSALGVPLVHRGRARPQEGPMSASATHPSSRAARDQLILVSGATGYVGGRLVPRLLAAGHRVRCLVRDPSRLQGRDWLPHVEVATGDVLRPAGLAEALAGVDVAYYLIHSMAGRERLPRARHRGGEGLRPRRRRRRRRPHRLPRRPRRPRGRHLRPSALAPRDRRRAA